MQGGTELQIVIKKRISLANGNGHLHSAHHMQRFEIVYVGNEVRRIVKIHLFVVVAIEKVTKTADPASQIVPATESNDPAEEPWMAHGDVNRMIGAHTAAMGNERGPVI
jgi:hypothetical protein